MNTEKIKNKLKPIVYPIINFIPRRRLKNKNFRSFVIIVGLEKFIKNWACLIKHHL